jgi:ribosomal protein S18 acetylase RimI-like enzyme
MPEITILDKTYKRLAVDILGEAFAFDPFNRWIVDDSAYPAHIFGLMIEHFARYGLVVVNDGKNAALLAIRPHVGTKYSPSLPDVWRFYRRFGLGALIRLVQTGRFFDKHHFARPHYYLFAIGTTEKARGRGEGKKLLRSLIERANQEGVAIYAENSNPEAMTGFYRSLGFQSLSPIRVSPSSPEVVPILYTPTSDV